MWANFCIWVMAQLCADAPQAQVVNVERRVERTSPMARLRAGLGGVDGCKRYISGASHGNDYYSRSTAVAVLEQFR